MLWPSLDRRSALARPGSSQDDCATFSHNTLHDCCCGPFPRFPPFVKSSLSKSGSFLLLVIALNRPSIKYKSRFQRSARGIRGRGLEVRVRGHASPPQGLTMLGCRLHGRDCLTGSTAPDIGSSPTYSNLPSLFHWLHPPYFPLRLPAGNPARSCFIWPPLFLLHRTHSFLICPDMPSA